MPNPQDDQVHKPDQQQVDPRELSGEQEKPKQEPQDSLEAERKKLEALQDRTEAAALEIAANALGTILSMGWTFDAKIGADGKPEFCISPIPLETWQDVNRELLRNKLGGGRNGGIILPHGA